MSLKWIHEGVGRWDAGKARVIGGTPGGVFERAEHAVGAPLSGEWWRVDDGAVTVGYGWMDASWEGAEILLAVDSSRQREGIGGFILDHLEAEAAARDLNYIYNTVRPTHPDRAGVTRWLESRGFTATADGELRRHVHRR